MPKIEGQYTGEIEMETDYEVSEDVLSSLSMQKRGNLLFEKQSQWFQLAHAILLDQEC